MDIVTILNWQKFNPRNDIKFHSWFRLQNTIFEDPDFFSLSHAEKLFWIYLLCSASKKRSNEVKIIKDHVKKIGGFSESEVNSSIKKLSYYGFIEYKNVEPNADVTETLRTRDTTYKQTNKQTYMAKSSVNFSAEFETVWKMYQREAGKGGKRAALAEFKKAKLADDDLELLKIAIPRYLAKTEDQYRQHFRKFLKDDTWREFAFIEPPRGQKSIIPDSTPGWYHDPSN